MNLDHIILTLIVFVPLAGALLLALLPDTGKTMQWGALGITLVTYEIEQTGAAARLTMTESHDRPISDDILSGGRQGWPAILSSLKSVLETGQPLSVKMAPPQRMLAALKELGIKTP